MAKNKKQNLIFLFIIKMIKNDDDNDNDYYFQVDDNKFVWSSPPTWLWPSGLNWIEWMELKVKPLEMVIIMKIINIIMKLSWDER